VFIERFSRASRTNSGIPQSIRFPAWRGDGPIAEKTLVSASFRQYACVITLAQNERIAPVGRNSAPPINRRRRSSVPNARRSVAPGIAGNLGRLASVEPSSAFPVRALLNDDVVGDRLPCRVGRGRDLLGHDNLQAILAQCVVLLAGAAVEQTAEVGELVDVEPDNRIVRVALVDRLRGVDRLDVARQCEPGSRRNGRRTRCSDTASRRAAPGTRGSPRPGQRPPIGR
jgi:hypothetical protein